MLRSPPDKHYNQIVLGNAFESPVFEILNGTKYRLLRIAHREKTLECFPYCNQCDQLLPHADTLVYTNRHNLPREIAVRMSNTDLYNLVKDRECGPRYLHPRYAEGLLRIAMAPGRQWAGE